MKNAVFATFLVIAAVISPSSGAAIWTFEGGMNTEQSAATHALAGLTGFGGGFVSATLDDATGDFVWDIFFGGLSGPAVAAHFHAPAFSGSAAGVSLATPSLVGAPAGIFSGASVLGATAIAELTGGGAFTPGSETPWYHNIHTAANPAGELRGQLFVSSVVPLPPALWLFSGAALVMLGLRRRNNGA